MMACSSTAEACRRAAAGLWMRSGLGAVVVVFAAPGLGAQPIAETAGDQRLRQSTSVAVSTKVNARAS